MARRKGTARGCKEIERKRGREKRGESFSNLMQCRRKERRTSCCGCNDNERAGRRWWKRCRGDDEMTRKRWMTSGVGTRDVGRMVYQTGWLPSLFRIRMRIRLTYSCTGTTLRYPSYSLFAFCPDVRELYACSSASASEENGRTVDACED